MSTTAPFGRVLVEQRRRRGMSRSELADAAELSYPYVSQLETGLRKPSRKAAEQLANALELDVRELESTIPTDLNDAASVRRAQEKSVEVLSRITGSRATEDFGVLRMETATGAGRGKPTDREALIDHLVDLVEELEGEDRVDALAEVQKRVVRRLLGR